jgi:FMN reductase
MVGIRSTATRYARPEKGCKRLIQREVVRITGLCGSLRLNGFTKKALSVALTGATESGAVTQLIDLGEYDLPFCNGETGEMYRGSPGVRRLRQNVGMANGIILATPSYHGTISGVLKNALDLLSTREFDGKVVGFIGVSGDRVSGASALATLRTIGKALHAHVIPSEVWIYDAASAFAANGFLRDDATAQRVREVGQKVVRLTQMLVSKEARDLLGLWENAD